MARARVRAILAVVGAAVLCGTAFADPIGRLVPERYAARALDGTPVIAEHPIDGTSWAAWAYRDGAEYSIAVSVLGVDGAWSEPVFLGRDDDLDQVEPSLAIDTSGTAYLAFGVRETGEIHVSLLIGGAAKWSTPVRISEVSETASSPAIRIVAGRVVVAYATDAGTRLLDFELVPGMGNNHTHGVQEGPDVIDPLGREMDDADGRSGEEAGTSDGTAWRGAHRGAADGGVEVRNAGRRTNEDERH